MEIRQVDANLLSACYDEKVGTGLFERKCEMNNRFVRLLSLCVVMAFLLAGCQPDERSMIPITGADTVSMPALVGQARDHVLEYVVSSTRLAGVPASTEWQLSAETEAVGEFHFQSGDWRMVIHLAETPEENLHVIIFNQAESAHWCGYVKSDGQVVDTALLR